MRQNLGAIKTRVAQRLHKTFKTIEKEGQRWVQSEKRDMARGRSTAAEMLALEPRGGLPEGGRSRRDHPHLQRSRVLKRLKGVCSD